MDSPPCEVCAIYIYMCVVYGVFYKGGAYEAPPCETHAVYVWRIISHALSVQNRSDWSGLACPPARSDALSSPGVELHV